MTDSAYRNALDESEHEKNPPKRKKQKAKKQCIYCCSVLHSL